MSLKILIETLNVDACNGCSKAWSGTQYDAKVCAALSGQHPCIKKYKDGFDIYFGITATLPLPE